MMDKRNSLVVVVTAGNYNRRDITKGSFDIYPDFVFPAITESDSKTSGK